MTNEHSSWTRARLGFIASVALVLWTAETCTPLPEIRILSPKPGLDATYEPLLIEIDFGGLANLETFQATLNGVDITADFTFELRPGWRRRAMRCRPGTPWRRRVSTVKWLPWAPSRR